MTRDPQRSQAKSLRFPGGTGGFTLIEALIAISAFVVVLLAIYSGFESSQATYGAGQQKADIQQSARIAMELMEGDLRLAGYGFPNGGADCDGDLNPDNAIMVANATFITFCADLLNASTIILNIDVNPGDTTLNVQNASGIQAGDTIFLINGGASEPLTAQAVNTGANPHTITTAPGAAAAYPWGSQVGRPLPVRYCWYDNPDTDGIPAPAACAGLPANTLYRDEGAGAGLQPLADNIQSLQFLYFDANDVATGNPVDIRRITITLAAQSPPGWWRPQSFNIASDVRPRNLN
ncbi:MAG: PilW family protein [Candidatus Methylomirabilales bacterium]